MGNLQEDRKLQLSSESLRDLDVTRKWSIFLAVMGFIGITVVFLTGIIAFLFLNFFKTSKSLSGMPEGFAFISLAAFAVVSFFPLRHLYYFSKHTGEAVKKLDEIEIVKAFKNLKKLNVFLGILVIFTLVFYLSAFILSGSSLVLINSLK